MYYLLVHSQLVLLTPVLFRLLSRYRFFVYCVTPACLLLRELAAVAGIALPLIQVFCPMWLIFYVFGLDWRRWAALIEGRTTQLVAVLFIFLIIQEVAGFWWYLTGDFNMATTQLKLGSAATSLAVIALLMAVPGSFKSRLSSTLLVDLGNASFWNLPLPYTCSQGRLETAWIIRHSTWCFDICCLGANSCRILFACITLRSLFARTNSHHCGIIN